ncbi:hypothetical protein V6N11_051127 [Hibiscus sabdariffa]|uniref:Uncharacterized protein n=1 Tax=Hibiscus sabdariffa TaxID=183260 RepID=A0ABR2R399_9ROSI
MVKRVGSVKPGRADGSNLGRVNGLIKRVRLTGRMSRVGSGLRYGSGSVQRVGSDPQVTGSVQAWASRLIGLDSNWVGTRFKSGLTDRFDSESISLIGPGWFSTVLTSKTPSRQSITGKGRRKPQWTPNYRKNRERITGIGTVTNRVGFAQLGLRNPMTVKFLAQTATLSREWWPGQGSQDTDVHLGSDGDGHGLAVVEIGTGGG